ncbi:hypothetical protein COP1_006483 [Malus domestica]
MSSASTYLVKKSVATNHGCSQAFVVGCVVDMRMPEISIKGICAAKVCSTAFGASLGRVVAFVRKLCICQGLRLYRRRFGFGGIVRHDDDCR